MEARKKYYLCSRFRGVCTWFIVEYQFFMTMDAILEQLKEYFNNTPRDVVEKEWREYDKYNKIGPTVNEYLAYINQILVKSEIKPIESTKIDETPNYYSEFFYNFVLQ